MIMICFGHGCSDARYRGPLETMFEDRKRLFVDLLGWDLSVQDARWDFDQFDDADAVYLIALDHTGDHAALLSLLPSNNPHIVRKRVVKGKCVTVRVEHEGRPLIKNKLQVIYMKIRTIAYQ